MAYLVIDWTKVHAILLSEGYTTGLSDAGATRSYIIKLDDGAISVKLSRGSTDIIIGETRSNGEMQWGCSEAEAVVAAASMASYTILLGEPQKYNYFKNIPVAVFSYVSLYTKINPIYATWGNSVGFITQLFTPYSSGGAMLFCDQASIQWRDGGVELTLRYRTGFQAATSTGVSLPAVISHSVRAQRYPSVYNGFVANGVNDLNLVTYNNDSVVAELPDAYQGEWHWDIAFLTPEYPGVYSDYPGCVNATAMNKLVPTGMNTQTCPASYSYGIMCDSYEFSVTSGIGIFGSSYCATPLVSHRLQFVGYDQKVPSGDSGFTRRLFYTSGGEIPPDVDPDTENGTRNVLCGVPHDFLALRNVLGG